MKFFTTDKKLQDMVDGLQSQIKDFEAENTDLKEKLTVANESITNKDQEIATLTEAKTELEGHVSNLTETNDKLSADLEESKQATVDAEESATAKAKQMIAALGHTEKLKVQEEETKSEVTRAEQRAMSPNDRAKFFASGGKIKG